MMHKPTVHRSAIPSLCWLPLWLILFTLLTVAQSVLAQPVKIMPIGSWTEGRENHVSYRYDLWFNLIDAGFDVDFVGNRRFTADDPDLDLYPEYLTSFDRDHQGQSSTFTEGMVGAAKAASTAHHPDIVMLWMGSYDIFQLGISGVPSASIGIRDTIDGIRSVVPGVTVLLGLTHKVSVLKAEEVAALNDAITTIALEMDTPQSPVIVVDLVTGWDPTGKLLDGIHHNRVGEAWVAERWFEVLADILPASEPFQINAGHNGSWWGGPDRSGEGAQFEISDGGNGSRILVATVYSYDQLGNQIFMIAVGTVNGDTVEVEIFITEGGMWGDDFDPALVSESQWGSGTFRSSNCETINMELRPNADYQARGYSDLMYDMVRLTTPVTPCPVVNAN